MWVDRGNAAASPLQKLYLLSPGESAHTGSRVWKQQRKQRCTIISVHVDHSWRESNSIYFQREDPESLFKAVGWKTERFTEAFSEQDLGFIESLLQAKSDTGASPCACVCVCGRGEALDR